MSIHVFGYGSLMNPKSLQKTLPGERSVERAAIKDYQRKLNAPYNGHLYLNIVPAEGRTVEGVIIAVTRDELELLKQREVGYDCVNVSYLLDKEFDGTVYAFIAPNMHHPGLTIPRSYILTCTHGKTEEEAAAWLQETIIENDIIEDATQPVYKNVAMD